MARAITCMVTSMPEISGLAPDDARLLPMVKQLHHRQVGLSADALKHRKTAFRAAIRWFKGELVDVERHPEPPSGPWAPLYADLLARKPAMTHTERSGLTQFMRDCSNKGAAPAKVTDADVLAYRASLEHRQHTNANGQARGAVRGWNIARGVVPGWPDILLTLPSRARKSFLANDDQLSDEFKSEFRRYIEHMEGKTATPPDAHAEPFDLEAAMAAARPGRPLKPSVVRFRIRIVRQGAGLLSLATGMPIARIALADLAVPENVQRILNRYAKEIGKKRSHGLRNMVDGLRPLAVSFYRAGPDVLAKFSVLHTLAAPPGEKGMTRKNRDRLLALSRSDIESIYRLPATLLGRVFTKVQAGLPLTRPEVVDAEVGLAVAILLNIPLRGENLVTLAVGEQLHLSDGDHRARIVVEADDTKGNSELIFPVPPDLARLIRRYHTVLTPEVPKMRGGKFLFAGVKNDTKGRAALGTQISVRLKRELGLQMNMHLFRHLIAVLYLARHPGQYEPVRLLLGHADVQTTIRFYASLATAAILQHVMREMGQWKIDAGLDPDDMGKTR